MVSVSINALKKSFGENTVLPGLNLEVEDGEFVTLLGPSGCGKTTTLRCVAGLERPTSGEIHINGRPVVTDRVFVPANRRRLGMVFQSYALWPHMSVYGNVAYPLRTQRVPRAEQGGRVREALETVGLSQLATRGVGTLSGGQQQRVALARAIVARPQLLLFDEPLSNLDAKLRTTMRTELQMLHRSIGTTSLYVTHDQTEAMTLSDRVVVMNHGEIQQIGTPEEVYSRPANPFVADFVGFENLLEGVAGGPDEVLLGDGTALRGRAMDTIRPGQKVRFAVRAAAVGVTRDPDALAVIRNATFLGDQREYLIEIGDRRIRARVDIHDDMAGLDVGDRVRLAPHPNAVLLYDGEDTEPAAIAPTDRQLAEVH